jgi:glyoxylase-like metal-dependent hydrolase (beta-lactamase superfamily II)
MPLEDELGDVLDKAMRRVGLTEHGVAERAGVAPERLRDALDYRGELTCEELCRLAAVLGLNEVGVCALGVGRYPRPEIGPLPFRVWPLRMPHGIGVVNAYLVGEGGSPGAVLFDTGAGLADLAAVWPSEVQGLEAVFVTHVEREHAGGLCGVVERFRVPAAFVPEGIQVPCGVGVGEGEVRTFGALRIRVFATPGHVAAHNCYLVERVDGDRAGAMLFSGDLLFAGSVGGAFFSSAQLHHHLQRLLGSLQGETVIAPGHGPLTTVWHELRYNPFCSPATAGSAR